jgi:dienelactone hydrolase
MPCLIVLLALGCPKGAPTPSPEDPVTAPQSPAERGRQFVRLLSEGQFASAAGWFDPTMASVMSVDALAALWGKLLEAGGPLQSLGEPYVQELQGHAAVMVPAQFERAPLVLRVVLDAQGVVAGLFVQPVGVEWAPPPYADPAALTERELALGDSAWPLPGTLTVPAGASSVPAVVLVHGSGPNDRDETLLARKAFKDLAWGLASRGIAVLRYDKRTKVHPQQLLALGSALTVEQEVIEDAVAAVAVARSQPEVRGECVFVLGHSLGGTVAPRIGARDSELAGLVIAAGSARPLEDIVVDQVEYLTRLAGSPPAQVAELETLRAQAARIKALQPGASSQEPLMLGLSATYWLDLRAYDAPAAARSLDLPMLILQGGRDYQVTSADLELWKAALSDRDDVTWKSYPALDHHFGAGEGPGRPEDYARPAPVAQEVIDDLAAWIQGRCP